MWEFGELWSDIQIEVLFFWNFDFSRFQIFLHQSPTQISAQKESMAPWITWKKLILHNFVQFVSSMTILVGRNALYCIWTKTGKIYSRFSKNMSPLKRKKLFAWLFVWQNSVFIPHTHLDRIEDCSISADLNMTNIQVHPIPLIWNSDIWIFLVIFFRLYGLFPQ